jgi:hypothetical protein
MLPVAVAIWVLHCFSQRFWGEDVSAIVEF